MKLEFKGDAERTTGRRRLKMKWWLEGQEED